jgi:hypothetical protein
VENLPSRRRAREWGILTGSLPNVNAFNRH